MIKSATPTSIHELFSHEKNIFYEIPKYQREYSWTKDQWSALFNDLMEDDARSGHFLGTIIGVDKTVAVLNSRALEVVDGQQRLTTIALLLVAIYSELQERKDQLTNDDHRSDLTNLRRMLISGENAQPRIKLQIQNNNSADFLAVMKEGGLEVEAANIRYSGNRKIRKAYRFFKNCIQERIRSESISEITTLLDILNRTKKALIVSLEVHSHADAFVLFESLNNRGLALTPIDLIKNSLLEKADNDARIGIDRAYSRWTNWLNNLGGEYRDHERFFRQFYNAFKTQWNLAVPNIPVATRSKLITIFEEMLKGEFNQFADRMDKATNAYKLIITNDGENAELTELEIALKDLSRVEGASSYILMLNLLVNRTEYGLSDSDLTSICRILISFFVRRNLTNTPPTYALDRLFITIAESWNTEVAVPPIEKVRSKLLEVSVSDSAFLERLMGPIYEENGPITRFILVQLAEDQMNNEKWRDLWARVKIGESKEQFRWTIEHIVPQGENMPDEWKTMLGGDLEAERILNEEVHRLGNLTITGYNSTLSNLPFVEKRDRKDNKPPYDYIGYRNGLELNEPLKDADSWTGIDIERRTRELANAALNKFLLNPL